MKLKRAGIITRILLLAIVLYAAVRLAMLHAETRSLQNQIEQLEQLEDSLDDLQKAMDAAQEGYAAAKKIYDSANALYIQYQAFLSANPDCATTARRKSPPTPLKKPISGAVFFKRKGFFFPSCGCNFPGRC